MYTLTDVGAIIVDPSAVLDPCSSFLLQCLRKNATVASLPDGSEAGPADWSEYGVSTDWCGVAWRGKNPLWLPAEFRPSRSVGQPRMLVSSYPLFVDSRFQVIERYFLIEGALYTT
jgi:hypothetical protein